MPTWQAIETGGFELIEAGAYYPQAIVWQATNGLWVWSVYDRDEGAVDTLDDAKAAAENTLCEVEFALANDPPPHKPQRFENASARQRVLIDGANCLPGQLDLF